MLAFLEQLGIQLFGFGIAALGAQNLSRIAPFLGLLGIETVERM